MFFGNVEICREACRILLFFLPKVNNLQLFSTETRAFFILVKLLVKNLKSEIC